MKDEPASALYSRWVYTIIFFCRPYVKRPLVHTLLEAGLRRNSLRHRLRAHRRQVVLCANKFRAHFNLLTPQRDVQGEDNRNLRALEGQGWRRLQEGIRGCHLCLPARLPIYFEVDLQIFKRHGGLTCLVTKQRLHLSEE